MKLNEDILNQFDVTPIETREPVNIMKVAAVLTFLRESAERIGQKASFTRKLRMSTCRRIASIL